MGMLNNGLYPVKALIDRLPLEWRKVLEFQRICSVEDAVVATLRNGVKQRLEQQFVETATEDGIKRFEEDFGIVPKTTDNLEDRRYRIRTYMMIETPFTERSLLSSLESLCGKGNVTISVNPSAYTVTVRVALSASDAFDDTKAKVEKVIPCNMVLDLSLLYNWHDMFTTYTHDQLSTYTHSQLREYENFGGE